MFYEIRQPIRNYKHEQNKSMDNQLFTVKKNNLVIFSETTDE